jgi:hypothetical protein
VFAKAGEFRLCGSLKCSKKICVICLSNTVTSESIVGRTSGGW